MGTDGTPRRRKGNLAGILLSLFALGCFLGWLHGTLVDILYVSGGTTTVDVHVTSTSYTSDDGGRFNGYYDLDGRRYPLLAHSGPGAVRADGTFSAERSPIWPHQLIFATSTTGIALELGAYVLLGTPLMLLVVAVAADVSMPERTTPVTRLRRGRTG